MIQPTFIPKHSQKTENLHALTTVTAQQRYRNPSLSSSSKSSWISELKKLEQRLLTEEQNTDVFSLLAAEISDVKLAGYIKKIQIQDSQDTFNRELEMDDLLSEIAAIRRQAKMIQDKMKENANDPQTTKHWIKKAQEFETKMDEFKLFQGQNYELIEKEEKELAESIEEIRRQEHIEKSKEKDDWKPNIEQKPFRSMRNFIEESISKEESPQKNSTEEEESSGIISILDRQSVDFDNFDQTTIADIAQEINDQEIARRQMLSKVTEKPEEENVGFSNKLSSEDSKTNNLPNSHYGIASNNIKIVSSNYIENVEDKQQVQQVKDIKTQNNIKQTKSEIIDINNIQNNSQFMKNKQDGNNQRNKTPNTRTTSKKEQSLKMEREQPIIEQQQLQQQIIPNQSCATVIAYSPIKQEQIDSESKIKQRNSHSQNNASLGARKDSLTKIRQSSQDLHQNPIIQPKITNDSATKFKNIIQSNNSSYFYDTPLKNNNNINRSEYYQQENNTNSKNSPGSHHLQGPDSQTNEQPNTHRGQQQSSSYQRKLQIKQNDLGDSFVQQNSLLENSIEEKSTKRKIIVIKKKNNDSRNIFSIKIPNILNSNHANYMDILNKQLKQSKAAQYPDQPEQENNRKPNRSISLPKPREKSSSVKKRSTTSNQLSEECCQEVSRLSKIIAAQAEDEKDAEQLKHCVKKIEEAIESNGGMQCGWNDLEHRCFVYFIKKYGYQFHALSKLLKEDKGLQGLLGIPKGAMVEHQQRVEFRNQLLAQKAKYISDFQQVTSRIETSKQLQLQHQKKQHQYKFLNTPSPKFINRLNIHSSEGNSKYIRVTPEYKIDYNIRGISQEHPPAPQILYHQVKQGIKIPQILSTPLKNYRSTTKSLSPESNNSQNNLNRDNTELEEMRNNLQAKLDQLNYLRAQTNSKRIPKYVYKNQQFFTPQIGRKNRNFSPSLLAMS